MKLIKSYIRTYVAYDVIHALKKIGVPRINVIDISEFHTGTGVAVFEIPGKWCRENGNPLV